MSKILSACKRPKVMLEKSWEIHTEITNTLQPSTALPAPEQVATAVTKSTHTFVRNSKPKKETKLKHTEITNTQKHRKPTLFPQPCT